MADLVFETELQAAARTAYFYLSGLEGAGAAHMASRLRDALLKSEI